MSVSLECFAPLMPHSSTLPHAESASSNASPHSCVQEHSKALQGHIEMQQDEVAAVLKVGGASKRRLS